MVKLASARECRMYGPRLSRNRAEYVNAGLYLFAAVVILGGLAAELFSAEAKSGLALMMIGFAVIGAVNVHDLMAHVAGYDYRVGLMEFDLQLAVVEFAAPLVQALGSLLLFLALLFIFIQEVGNYKYPKLERHAMNMLIVGPVLWVIGSIHNSCQIYERADGHLQILQHGVQIPFLIGSVLLVAGAIINSREQVGLSHHGRELLGKRLIWIGIFGTLFLIVGGFMNLVKVFKMQQRDSSLRLEKLRGGAQERLAHQRERQVPLILEDHHRRKRQPPHAEEETAAATLAATATATTGQTSTRYKDVLVGHSQA